MLSKARSLSLGSVLHIVTDGRSIACYSFTRGKLKPDLLIVFS